MKFDHRGGRRLYLKKRVPAMMLGGRAEILDISVDSAGVEHDFPLQIGATTFLEFSWGKDLIRLACAVARTQELQPGRDRSGLKIDLKKSANGAEFTRLVNAALEKLRDAEAKLLRRSDDLRFQHELHDGPSDPAVVPMTITIQNSLCSISR